MTTKIKVTEFGDCPYCGENILKNGLGVVSKCTQILRTYHNYYSNKSEFTYDDLDIEDTIEYYCPCCGEDLENKLGEKLEKELLNV